MASDERRKSIEEIFPIKVAHVERKEMNVEGRHDEQRERAKVDGWCNVNEVKNYAVLNA